MLDQNTKAQGAARRVVLERETNRWLMLLYDSAVYVVCWLLIFWAKPFHMPAVTTAVEILCLLLGYVMIFGFRLVLGVYKQIWRNISVHALSREVTALVLGSIAFVTGAKVAEYFSASLAVPASAWLTFAIAYLVVSVLIRLVYSVLYRIARKEKSFLGRFLKKLFTALMFVDFASREPGAVMRLTLESRTASESPINEVQNIVEKFAIRGEVTTITQLNKGYINRTYRVETLSETGHVHKYTLQRINSDVFPDVDALMENFKLTTNHLHSRLVLAGTGKMGSVQTLRPTKKGTSYLRDSSGCWRMMTYFDDVYSLDIPDSPETFYHAGKAFGQFICEMESIDASSIHTVIPNFHNTKSRYVDLEAAVDADPKGRVKDVQKELAFVRERADRYAMISDALESGRIPTRICHNDTNLNNILFDNETHLPVAIIDLDTVMPSSPLYDYGDSMRIGTNTAKDDEKDLSKVSCDLNLYKQYARGYLESCGAMLTKEELELLPYASLIITSEDGIRFLMDHINGDTYYNIYYPGQNLDRARTQLKLVEDMELKLPEIKKILQGIYAELGLNTKFEKTA